MRTPSPKELCALGLLVLLTVLGAVAGGAYAAVKTHRTMPERTWSPEPARVSRGSSRRPTAACDEGRAAERPRQAGRTGANQVTRRPTGRPVIEIVATHTNADVGVVANAVAKGPVDLRPPARRRTGTVSMMATADTERLRRSRPLEMASAGAAVCSRARGVAGSRRPPTAREGGAAGARRFRCRPLPSAGNAVTLRARENAQRVTSLGPARAAPRRPLGKPGPTFRVCGAVLNGRPRDGGRPAPAVPVQAVAGTTRRSRRRDFRVFEGQIERPRRRARATSACRACRPRPS